MWWWRSDDEKVQAVLHRIDAKLDIALRDLAAIRAEQAQWIAKRISEVQARAQS